MGPYMGPYMEEPYMGDESVTHLKKASNLVRSSASNNPPMLQQMQYKKMRSISPFKSFWASGPKLALNSTSSSSNKDCNSTKQLDALPALGVFMASLQFRPMKSNMIPGSTGFSSPT